MIALFFEVTPRTGQDDRYLEIAASLRPALDQNGGCQHLDRFRSLSRPRTMLSHQIWRDEASLARWRANGRHHGAQTAGRQSVFEDYRLRVGAVVAEALPGAALRDLPVGAHAYNDPQATPERWIVAVRSTDAPFAGQGEAWRSVYDERAYTFVAGVSDRASGLDLVKLAAAQPGTAAARLVLVSRDYGMHDRAEAPQWFSDSRG